MAAWSTPHAPSHDVPLIPHGRHPGYKFTVALDLGAIATDRLWLGRLSTPYMHIVIPADETIVHCPQNSGVTEEMILWRPGWLGLLNRQLFCQASACCLK